MPIEILVKCDGLGCGNYAEIEDNHDSDVEEVGYRIYPNMGYTYFCPTCQDCPEDYIWPVFKTTKGKSGGKST